MSLARHDDPQTRLAALLERRRSVRDFWRYLNDEARSREGLLQLLRGCGPLTARRLCAAARAALLPLVYEERDPLERFLEKGS